MRVHRVGICGTDISGYLGKMPFFSYPRIPGHELGVEVLAVGAGRDQRRPGRPLLRRAVHQLPDSATPAGAARPTAARSIKTLGVHCDGGLRPQFLVPARKLHVSAKLAFEQLALVETLAIGCHAVERAAPQPDESCLIIGAGPIGLATLEFVKLTGAKVIVLDVNEQRLDFCRRSWASRTRSSCPTTLEKELRDLTDGHLPDVVIDATGTAFRCRTPSA